MRYLALSLVLVLPLASQASAQPHILKATALPEPGLLFALGAGLIGLATLIRRHYSE